MRDRRVRAVVLWVAALLAPARAIGADLDELYAPLLARHTRETPDVAGVRVDYAAIAADPDWRAFVAALAEAPVPADSAPRAERLAYWIDAYNALAIDLVARNLPLASIRDLGSLLRPVWRRSAGTLGGRSRSLDEIEHAILRPMGEPRVHAAIVCASTSCPSLAREPWIPARIETQLDAAARRFVGDRAKGARVEGGVLRLSSIFDWFEGDFAASGGVPAFVRRYADPALAAEIAALGPDPRIEYLGYDWSLNGVR
jgi:hypothetical protein